MQTVLWILLAVFVLAILLLSLVLHKTAVVRDEKRDWNYDPAVDGETMQPSGRSPYRTSSAPSNKWWNTQPLERVEIKSEDGKRLVGHLLRAETETDRVAVVLHGHRCVSGEMGFIAKIYADRGWNVFMPDQRAHGKSEGRYIGMGWLEKRDVLCWLRKLRELLGSELRVVLHGISMGAATTMMTVGEKDLPGFVKCAVEDCGYTDAFDSFLFHMQRDTPQIPFKKLLIAIASGWNRIVAGYGFRQASSVPALERSRIPMLFIHGTHDNVVPFEMMRTLYDACGGDKKMFIVEGAAHGVAYFHDPALYEKTVMDFVETYIPRTV